MARTEGTNHFHTDEDDPTKQESHCTYAKGGCRLDSAGQRALAVWNRDSGRPDSPGTGFDLNCDLNCRTWHLPQQSHRQKSLHGAELASVASTG